MSRTSRQRVSATGPLAAEFRLRVGLATLSVLVALSLVALLTVLSLLRGTPPAPAMLLGIALGLCAELLCLDIALRRVRRRLGDVGGTKASCGGFRALPAVS